MVDHASRFESSVANSRIVRWLTASNTYRTASAIARAPQYASVTRLLQTVARWTRASILFRWLTKEPEPTVIAIDLRDTYTVGPFIVMLDWLISALEPAYRHSQLRATSARIAHLGARLADTRAGRFLVAALDPPEPAYDSADPGSEKPGEPDKQAGEANGVQFSER